TVGRMRVLSRPRGTCSRPMRSPWGKRPLRAWRNAGNVSRRSSDAAVRGPSRTSSCPTTASCPDSRNFKAKADSCSTSIRMPRSARPRTSGTRRRSGSRRTSPGPDGKITITTKYPDIIPVFRYARDPEVRRRLQWEHLNRGHPANLATLSKLMATRHELARVLGHESFADYIVQDKMIGSAKGIGDFLAKVRAASEERAKEDSEILIARKRKDVPNATSLQAWDTNFYSELVRAENFDFDAKLLRPYF